MDKLRDIPHHFFEYIIESFLVPMMFPFSSREPTGAWAAGCYKENDNVRMVSSTTTSSLANIRIYILLNDSNSYYYYYFYM
jgi:hypothetical protein